MRCKLCGILLTVGAPAFAQQAGQSQPTIQYILLALLVLILIIVAVDILRRSKRPEDSNQYKLLCTQHADSVKEANQLRGRVEQLQAETIRFEGQLNAKSAEVTEGTKKLAAYAANDANQKSESDKRILDLENARKTLENERKRVMDSEMQAREEEERIRTRIWSLHEDSSRAIM